MQNMPNPNLRRSFRIRYPVESRPRLVLGSYICEVLDCSERGLRFRPSGPLCITPGDALRGRLRFPRGEEIAIAGAAVRSEEGTIAIELSGRGVPFGVILQEQLYLRRAAR